MSKSVSRSDDIGAESSRVASGPPANLPWRERRAWFQARLQQEPLSGISTEEVEAHFASMPAHYWERVSEFDLVWGLETIHGFLRLVATPNVPATAPYMSRRQRLQSDRTRIMLCTWDRHGLLAKAAASFAAVRMNILDADVFTRADNIVLDVFSVVDRDRQAINAERLQEMTFLLEGALSEPPRFASIWACSRHKFVAPRSRFPARIDFDNNVSATSTLVHVEASDRLGLLYDILQTIADSGLNVSQACIETDEDQAHDIIHVLDEHGRKVTDPARLEKLHQSLEAALAQTG